MRIIIFLLFIYHTNVGHSRWVEQDINVGEKLYILVRFLWIYSVISLNIAYNNVSVKQHEAIDEDEDNYCLCGKGRCDYEVSKGLRVGNYSSHVEFLRSAKLTHTIRYFILFAANECLIMIN